MIMENYPTLIIVGNTAEHSRTGLFIKADVAAATFLK